jgi:hypothetical protein
MLEVPSGYECVVRWFDRLDRKHFSGVPEGEHLRRERVFLKAQMDEFIAAISTAIGIQYGMFCLTLHPDPPLM